MGLWNYQLGQRGGERGGSRRLIEEDMRDEFDREMWKGGGMGRRRVLRGGGR